MTGRKSAPGEEHHVVLRGSFRMTQGYHTIDIAPQEHVGSDGAIAHDGDSRGSSRKTAS